MSIGSLVLNISTSSLFMRPVIVVAVRMTITGSFVSVGSAAVAASRTIVDSRRVVIAAAKNKRRLGAVDIQTAGWRLLCIGIGLSLPAARGMYVYIVRAVFRSIRTQLNRHQTGLEKSSKGWGKVRMRLMNPKVKRLV